MAARQSHIPYTISKDNTAGESNRHADLLAYFGTRIQRPTTQTHLPALGPTQTRSLALGSLLAGSRLPASHHYGSSQWRAQSQHADASVAAGEEAASASAVHDFDDDFHRSDGSVVGNTSNSINGSMQIETQRPEGGLVNLAENGGRHYLDSEHRKDGIIGIRGQGPDFIDNYAGSGIRDASATPLADYSDVLQQLSLLSKDSRWHPDLRTPAPQWSAYSANATRVYFHLCTSSNEYIGFNLDILKRKTGLSDAEILDATEELMNDGLIYATVDDETWAALENDLSVLVRK